MAKHDIDPVLRQLVRAINESGNAMVPVTISVHGVQQSGALLGGRLYFDELVTQNPLMAALEPTSGLLGKEDAKTPRPNRATTCTSGPMRAACEGSALRPSTPGPCLRPPERHRTVKGRSPACWAAPEDFVSSAVAGALAGAGIHPYPRAAGTRRPPRKRIRSRIPVGRRRMSGAGWTCSQPASAGPGCAAWEEGHACCSRSFISASKTCRTGPPSSARA
jgi:hypothetical protein